VPKVEKFFRILDGIVAPLVQMVSHITEWWDEAGLGSISGIN
jgi:hypothetical protein